MLQCKIVMEQVREAIGITLSVLCSNIRLHLSSAHDCEEASEIDNQLKEEKWVLVMKDRASDVVTNIQNTSPADNLETAGQTAFQNGYLNGDAQDDVKWMETVLIFRTNYICFYNY